MAFCTKVLCFTDVNGEEEIGQRERATALWLACRYLPEPLLSAPGKRANMLEEAAKTYERLGDKKSLQNCRNMMMKFTNSPASAPIPVH